MAPEVLHPTWPQKAFLPLSPTSISTVESTNSPFQTLKLINCIISVLWTLGASFLTMCSPVVNSLSYLLHLPCWVPFTFSGKVVSWLKAKSLHMSWVHIFCFLTVQPYHSYLNFLCFIALKCKSGIVILIRELLYILSYLVHIKCFQ